MRRSLRLPGVRGRDSGRYPPPPPQDLMALGLLDPADAPAPVPVANVDFAKVGPDPAKGQDGILASVHAFLIMGTHVPHHGLRPQVPMALHELTLTLILTLTPCARSQFHAPLTAPSPWLASLCAGCRGEAAPDPKGNSPAAQ